MSEPGSRLVADVVDAKGLPLRAPGLARWLEHTVPASVCGHVTIALVSDANMRRLNRTFRGLDRATDVLSFPSSALERPVVETTGGRRRLGNPPAPRKAASSELARGSRAKAGEERPFLGDIVIATGVARRQARGLGHAASVELRVLALHGFLHLVGHDHARDRGEMARLERRLRRRGGLDAGLIEREPGS